jgi:hypothetical protein
LETTSSTRFCKDCKNFRQEIYSTRCMVFPDGPRHMVDGVQRYLSCNAARNTSVLCGTRGKYYEPK